MTKLKKWSMRLVNINKHCYQSPIHFKTFYFMKNGWNQVCTPGLGRLCRIKCDFGNRCKQNCIHFSFFQNKVIEYEKEIISLKEKLNTAAENERKTIEEQVNASNILKSRLISKH